MKFSGHSHFYQRNHTIVTRFSFSVLLDLDNFVIVKKYYKNKRSFKGVSKMDISIIKAESVTAETGIFIGEQAPKQTVEFMNVRCPYCKKWFEDSADILAEAVASGKLQRVIKLFDKEKQSLLSGNVMHRYISKTDGQQALLDLTKIYATQTSWAQLPLEDVATYAEETLHLTLQDDLDATNKIIAEANQANIQFVPTILLDSHIFDENIPLETLSSYLNQ